MFYFNDSGFLFLGDISNISGIIMIIKNDGFVKKVIVNLWKGIYMQFNYFIMNIGMFFWVFQGFFIFVS